MSKEQFRLFLVMLAVVIAATYVISQKRLTAAAARGLALAKEEAERRDAAARQTAETLMACANVVAEGLTRVAKVMAASEASRQIEATQRLEALKESNTKGTWPPMGFTAMPFATE